MALIPPASTGIGKLAASVGKPAKLQGLPGLAHTTTRGHGASAFGGTPRDNITGSSDAARQMNHYGKNPPPSLLGATPGGVAAASTSVSPVGHSGLSDIRGGSGGMRKHPRQGGLGEGFAGGVTPDGSSGPSTSTQDLE